MAERAVVPLEPRPRADFVETPFIRGIVDRAITYLRCGFAINLSGPSGAGKTTLALHIAARLGRPWFLMYGDEQLVSSDLIGASLGYRRRRVVDNFIQSVVKTEEDLSRKWVDSRLTAACKYGYTLVYDEFTRSHPEANNVLLAVLEEGILATPLASGSPGYMKVHPDFSAIFTSNPEEYAGVYRSQDALRDRMITLHLAQYDEETEVAITAAKAGITPEEAVPVVRLVRKIRKDGRLPVRPSVRSSIAIATILTATGLRFHAGDERVRQVVADILASHLHGGQEPETFIRSLSRIWDEMNGRSRPPDRQRPQRQYRVHRS